MTPEKTIVYKDHTIKLYRDEDAESPAEDTAVKLVTTRNRYFEQTPDGLNADIVGKGMKNGRYTDSTGIKWRVFRLYMYAHSGVALSISNDRYPFNDQWDAGQVGWVLVNPKELRNNRMQTSLDNARQSIETWNMYLSGDVWMYDVTNDKGDNIDSLGGIYGQDEAIKDAQASIDSQLNA